MKEFSKEAHQSIETNKKLSTTLSIDNLRAGHWPDTKTPPWLLNEMWERDNPEWKSAVKTTDLKENNEIPIGSGTLDDGVNNHNIDLYARHNPHSDVGNFYFVVYPKGKKFEDFWDEEGNERNQEE